MTPIRLALAVLHDGPGRVLVQLREPDKPYGGMWGLVGGHIEPGEAPTPLSSRSSSRAAPAAHEADGA